MNFNIFFALIILCCLYIYSHAHTNRKYRQDYEYIEATKSYYKLHLTKTTWPDAKRLCAVEGAQLFYPVDKEELDVVTSYWNKVLKCGTTKYIYVGISNYVIPEMYLTIDGKPASTIYNKWQLCDYPVSPKRCVALNNVTSTYFEVPCHLQYPFICKKTQDDLDWNTRCNMQNLDYTYNETEGRCYKFHNTRMSWTDAFKTCMLEESYLAIINYGREKNFFVSLLEKAFHGAPSNESVHLGFHNMIGDGWQTIKGEAEKKWGLAEWATGSPDQSALSDKKCGAMSSEGELIDIPCNTNSYFICEHDVEINQSLNEDSFRT